MLDDKELFDLMDADGEVPNDEYNVFIDLIKKSINKIETFTKQNQEKLITEERQQLTRIILKLLTYESLNSDKENIEKLIEELEVNLDIDDIKNLIVNSLKNVKISQFTEETKNIESAIDDIVKTAGKTILTALLLKLCSPEKAKESIGKMMMHWIDIGTNDEESDDEYDDDEEFEEDDLLI